MWESGPTSMASKDWKFIHVQQKSFLDQLDDMRRRVRVKGCDKCYFTIKIHERRCISGNNLELPDEKVQHSFNGQGQSDVINSDQVRARSSSISELAHQIRKLLETKTNRTSRRPPFPLSARTRCSHCRRSCPRGRIFSFRCRPGVVDVSYHLCLGYGTKYFLAAVSVGLGKRVRCN